MQNAKPNRITLALVDELEADTAKEATTTIVVQWPNPFAEEFSERPEVEKLLASLFSVR